jgi:hypothetical protein
MNGCANVLNMKKLNVRLNTTYWMNFGSRPLEVRKVMKTKNDCRTIEA